MIYLVVSLTFISANAFAVNVKITKNEGKNAIPGVLDAQGDIWSLEAVVEGAAAEVKAEDMSLTVEGADLGKFDICSSEFNNYKCVLQKGLTEIQEGDYNFVAVLSYLDPFGVGQTTKGSGLVIFDGSGPSVELLSLSQEEGKMKIKFTAKDKPASNCAGLEKVELLDSTGAVLHTFESGFTESQKCNELSKEESIGLSFIDAGTKVFKLKAYDKLGHTAYSSAKSFTYDKAAPQIGDGLWLNVGTYAGVKPLKLEAAVNVTEEGTLLSSDVKMTTSFWTDKAADSCTELEEHHYYCKWSGTEVILSDSVTFTVTAKDKWSNTASKAFTQSFTIDTEAPKVVFFGSDTKWDSANGGNDKNYISSEGSKLIAKIEDAGSGLDTSSVFADLQELGKGGYEKPTCAQDGSLWTCVWELGTVSSKTYFNAVLRLGVKDNAGNEILEAQTLALYYDDLAPLVEEFTVTGLGGEGGAKEFFKSGDAILIEGEVKEETGVRLLVDVNDILTNAADWPQITGEEIGVIEVAGNCLQNITDFLWNCQWTIENIKTGPDTAAIKFKVADTAGNAAEDFTSVVSENLNNPEDGKQCTYSTSTGFETCHLELLGLDTSMVPDFWTVNPTIQNGFVDLDTTQLFYTQAEFGLSLQSSTPGVEPKLVEIVDGSCKEKASGEGNATSSLALNKPRLMNNLESRNPVILLEFQPFDGKETFKDKIDAEGEKKGTFTALEIPITCDLRIYSTQSKNVFEQPEIKTAELIAKFGYTKLGALDANLDKKIKDAKDEIDTGFWGTLGTLNKIMKWVGYVIAIFDIILSIVGLFEGVGKPALEPASKVPATKPAADATCTTFGVTSNVLSESLDYLEIPLAVLTCRASGYAEKTLPGGGNWYSKWQEYIVSYYKFAMEGALMKNFGNVWTPGKGLEKNSNVLSQSSLFQPAAGIQDNLFLSFAGLCIPGIIKNMNQFREIKCRYVVCLETDVKQGLATVDMCEDLKDILECKYVWGEVWDILPFVSFYDKVIQKLWELLGDPITFFTSAIVITCTLTCPASPTASGFCSISSYIIKVMDILSNTIMLGYQLYQEFQDKGTSYCQMVGL